MTNLSNGFNDKVMRFTIGRYTKSKVKKKASPILFTKQRKNYLIFDKSKRRLKLTAIAN